MTCVCFFSYRRFGAKHFQTIHRCGVGVAHGLPVLFGVEDEVERVACTRQQ